MVAQAQRTAEQKRLEKVLNARFGKNSVQQIVNALMWRIIAQKNGGRIDIKAGDVIGVPPTVSIRAQYDKSRNVLILTAAVPTDGIVTPGSNGLIL